LTDQYAGLVVVRGERRIHGVRRFGRRVQRDDQHVLLLGLVDRGHDRLGVARRDENSLGAGGDQVFDRLDLGLVVAVLLTRERLELETLLLGFCLGALLHLHEERVGVGLGDQADNVAAATTAARAAGVATTACGRAESQDRGASGRGQSAPSGHGDTAHASSKSV
jgi:hypothetical protein